MTARLLTSMQRKGGERTMALMAGKTVRIWSQQWKSWWRPEAQGYTRDPGQAWVLPFEEAFRRTRHCGPEKGIEFQAVA
jgi:hypothetical protein